MRGCRCIEIDVWNGDAVTPATTSKSNKADHQRGISAISGSSLPYMANAVFDTVEDMNESVKTYIGEKSASHSRSASTTSRVGNVEDVSPRSSALFTAETKESMDKLEVSSTGISRSMSRSMSRSRSRQQMPKGEPIVTHGWTLTAPCGFREVCTVIRDSAFVDNDLPIIISLEVHADSEQQEVMVKIMKEVWQEMLVDQALEGFDPRFRIPSLQDLKGRILVKVKKAPARMIAPHNTVHLPASAVDDDTSDSEDEKTGHPPQKSASEPINGAKMEAKPDTTIPGFPICQALGDLAVYTRSEKFHSFDTPQAKKPPHIFSISEGRILELNEKYHSEMFRHNKGYFMRAFPAGIRIDSSNPDPSLFWRKGVQMVAMNWQNLDEGMMLNEGMFSDEKGYVLKPPGYQSSDKASETQHEAVPGKTLDLTITVFAGHQIPLEDAEGSSRGESDLRPLVKAELHVEKAEDNRKDGQTQECTYKQKTNAGRTSHADFSPQGTELRFHNIPRVVQELSFIR